MRFVQGDPRSVEVTWYWCAPGAQPGPYSIFASGNWASDPIWPWLGPGEVKGAPRPWYDGANPWGLVGNHRCGTDQQFAEGLDHWPTPVEWEWCCCAWPSRVRICLQCRPAEEAPVVSPSYAEPVEAIVFGGPWTSRACLCIAPRSEVPALVPGVSGYGSAAARAVELLTRACVCIAPRATVGPLAPGVYGYGSAPTAMPPATSRACICIAPSAAVGLLAPGVYGYGSASTAMPPATSRACVCIAPSAAVGLLAPAVYGYGSYSSAAGPVSSEVCVCIAPHGTVGKLTPDLYGSGGSYNRPGGVLTPCCPGRLIPFRLWMDIFGGAAGQQCDCLNGTYPLDYDLGIRSWVSSVINPCGGEPLLLTLSCSNDPAQCGPPTPWILVATAGGLTQSVCGSFDCNSLVGTFRWGAVMIGQCQNVDLTPIIISIHP